MGRYADVEDAAIHVATRNLRSQVRISFPVHAKRAIRMGRAVMVLVGHDEQRVVRSLGTFALPDGWRKNITEDLLYVTHL